MRIFHNDVEVELPAEEQTALRDAEEQRTRPKVEAPTAEQTASAAARARQEEQLLAEQLATAKRKRRETEARAEAAQQYETERAVMLKGFSNAFVAAADKVMTAKRSTPADWVECADELRRLRTGFEVLAVDSARDDREKFLASDYVARFTNAHPTARVLAWLAPFLG